MKRFVLVGASGLAVAVAKQLIKSGEEVVLIDRSRERLDELSDTLDCGMLQGDGTDPAVLRRAAGQTPGILLAFVDEDQDNILACLLGKQVGFERVIPTIENADLLALCDELDLYEAIAPEKELAERVLKKIGDEDRDQTLQWPARLYNLSIQQNDEIQKVSDVSLPANARTVGIYRGDTFIAASDEETLKADDRLVIVTDDEGYEELRAKANHG